MKQIIKTKLYKILYNVRKISDVGIFLKKQRGDNFAVQDELTNFLQNYIANKLRCYNEFSYKSGHITIMHTWLVVGGLIIMIILLLNSHVKTLKLLIFLFYFFYKPIYIFFLFYT